MLACSVQHRVVKCGDRSTYQKLYTIANLNNVVLTASCLSTVIINIHHPIKDGPVF